MKLVFFSIAAQLAKCSDTWLLLMVGSIRLCRPCKEGTGLKCSSFSDLQIRICTCGVSSSVLEGDGPEELSLPAWLVAEPETRRGLPSDTDYSCTGEELSSIS